MTFLAALLATASVSAAPWPANGTYAFPGAPDYVDGAFIRTDTDLPPHVAMYHNDQMAVNRLLPSGEFVTLMINITSHECVDDQVMRYTVKGLYYTDTTSGELSYCGVQFNNATHKIFATMPEDAGECPEPEILFSKDFGFAVNDGNDALAEMQIFERIPGVM